MGEPSFADYDDIASHYSGMYHIPGYDYDDLFQECRVVAFRVLPRLDVQKGSRSFVANAMKNHCSNLLTYATRQKREGSCCRVNTKSDWIANSDFTAEERLVATENLQNKIKSLSFRKKLLIEAEFERLGIGVIKGRQRKIVEPIDKLLENTLNVVLRNREEKTMPEYQPCHMLSKRTGENNEEYGYGVGDLTCIDCADKFSCLPLTIDKGMIEGKTVEEVDPEVAAVQMKLLTEDEVKARLVKREACHDSKKAVPKDLEYTAVNLKPGEKQEPQFPPIAPDPEEKTEEKPPESSKKKATKKKVATKKKAPAPPKAPKKKVTKKKVVKKAGTKKKATIKKATKKKVVKAKKVSKPKAKKKFEGKVKGDRRLFKVSGKPMPGQKELDSEGIELQLKRTNQKFQQLCGVPFGVEVGMEFIQQKRDGTEISILVTEKGFVWNKETYGSFSGACINATGRSVSAYDMFNFNKRRNIFIKGSVVPGGVYPDVSG